MTDSPAALRDDAPKAQAVRLKAERPMAAVYSIFLPVEGSPIRATVLPGAALVGIWREADDGERVLQIDYEANAHGSKASARFAQRCMHAAGRLTADYPTSSRILLSSDRVASELIEVGVYDEGERLVFLEGLHERAAVAAWLDRQDIASDELHAR